MAKSEKKKKYDKKENNKNIFNLFKKGKTR